MGGTCNRNGRKGRWALSRLLAFGVDRRGSISPMLTLMIIPLVGMLGVATEASSWFFAQRALQNAADSAVMAAATNGCASTIPACVSAKTPYYDAEAKSVATKLGFTNGVANTTVTVTNTATCPDGTPTCYGVMISRLMPINLTRLVGFNGDAPLGSGRAQTVKAVAMARPEVKLDSYCLLALASGGANVEGIRCNGCSKADLSGCKIATNGFARCNGGNLNADSSDAVGNRSDCAAGGTGTTGVDKIPDPYGYLKSNLSSLPACSGVDQTLPGGTLTLGATPTSYCGNITIGANLTIVTPKEGAVLVFHKSLIIPPGVTLTTAKDSGLTIVFTGTNTPGVQHILAGGGTVDVAAPTTGPWSGVAVYQDPALTTGIDWSAAGNSPTWNITGLIYLSKAAVTVSGIVNKASNGHNCFALVVDTFLSNGTTTFLEHQTECPEAGLKPPSGINSVRTALVQ